MKKKMNILFVVFLCCTLVIVFFGGEKMKLISVEDLDIYIGAGVGINKNGKSDMEFRIPATLNKYKEDESAERVINTGMGSTIGKTRENRQNKIGKQLFFGLAKIYLIEEEYARYGIRSLVDVNFKNPGVNNNLYLVVCKGRSEDYFNLDIPGYDNSAEFISDMVKNSVQFNFFKDRYMLQNAILSMDAEGKNIVSPYIEIKEDEITITGIAVFKKDKVASILDMKDTKTMNMLRENKVKGILTLQKNSKEYLNYVAESKRKIRCSKSGDKYAFIIDLNLKGEIVNDELYEGTTEKTETIKIIEYDIEKQVEEMCIVFLDNMKTEYKVDLLQLGWVAAAKYGRDTGVNWDEVISNSDIKVNVKVRVDKVGRGQY